MKNRSGNMVAAPALLALLTLNLQPSTAHAQGTAFTYQGQLQNNGALASGTYNLQFSLYTNSAGGTAVAGPVTNSAVAVTNGLFTVTMDFGGSVWNGQSNWLQIAVETNGSSSFTLLSPRQQATPTPYAIFAEGGNAAGLSGAVKNSQLANSSITVNAGAGLSGGGAVALGSSTTLTNAGVLSVSGNADITAVPASGVVTLGDTATNTDTVSTIVKRDGSGNFSAGSITLAGTLNLPATTASAGIIYSGASTLVQAFGTQNFFAGSGAGNLTLSGNGDTGVGFQALLSDTSGSDNTANGAAALEENTGGSYNTADGYLALYFNTNGSYNTANGVAALYENTSGSNNTANGVQALEFNQAGACNTANGVEALLSNTNGSDNTAIGYQALYSNIGGSILDGADNTANGYQALYSNASGSQNTANGFQALYYNIGGSFIEGADNTANGFQALYFNTNGSYNTANGVQALYKNTSGSYNTANGIDALYNNTRSSDNTANGYEALFFNTSGSNNTANGVQALLADTTGSQNTANGYEALFENNSGSNNTANGCKALYWNTGGNNTADGAFALGNLVGSGNTAVGYMAFAATDDQGNPMNNNTAIGYDALANLASGNNNIALGNLAGEAITSGTNNIHIGNSGLATDNDTIRIGAGGNQTYTYIAGIYGTTISAGTQVYIDSFNQLGVESSSARFKTDIQNMGDASDVLLALKPVTFKYRPGIDPNGTPQFGLIAEQVEKVDPELVVHDQEHGIYTVRYQAVNVMLLNEFLKEHKTIQEQSAEIQNLKQQLNELAAAVKSLEEGN